jgi:hypothetical protein
MSTAPTPDQGFMGRPLSAESVAALAAPPQARAVAPYDWTYQLPASVKDSAAWKGCEADLYFGVKEPEMHQIQRFNGRPLAEAGADFFRAIGERDADGNPIFEDDPTELDRDGRPVKRAKLRQIGYQEAAEWMRRIGTKAAQLALNEWGRTWNPTEAEGEAVRVSRRRA